MRWPDSVTALHWPGQDLEISRDIERRPSRATSLQTVTPALLVKDPSPLQMRSLPAWHGNLHVCYSRDATGTAGEEIDGPTSMERHVRISRDAVPGEAQQSVLQQCLPHAATDIIQHGLPPCTVSVQRAANHRPHNRDAASLL